MELAEQTAERYKKLPGFSSAPNGFEISEYAIDKDYWISGYIDMPADDNTKMWAQKDS